jgi:isopenicillin N synthase-like dioxygenase
MSLCSSPAATLDKWVSTLHRVIVPNNSGPRTARRQSMAFFVNVNGDTLIEPLSTCVTAEQPAKSKYAPVTARQHIMAKYLATMGHKEEEKY